MEVTHHGTLTTTAVQTWLVANGDLLTFCIHQTFVGATWKCELPSAYGTICRTEFGLCIISCSSLCSTSSHVARIYCLPLHAYS